MGVTENATLNVRREEGGKIRVTSSLWDVAKVLGKNEVLEVRNVERPAVPRLHAALPQRLGPGDRALDPYGPATRDAGIVTRHPMTHTPPPRVTPATSTLMTDAVTRDAGAVTRDTSAAHARPAPAGMVVRRIELQREWLDALEQRGQDPDSTESYADD